MAGIGSTPELLAAAALGAAASAALEPAFEVPRQDAWTHNPNRIIGVGLLAQLVAQGGVLLGNEDGSTKGSAYDEALRQGYTYDKLNRLIYLAQTAPDLALVLDLWRRGLLGDPTGKKATDLVEHAFAKHQIEPQYWPALEELFSSRLDPALVATMVQRSVLPNATDPVSGDKLLPNQPDSSKSDVPPMPQVDIDPIIEARANGIDFQRLAAEARIVGLPASPDLAARMHFRKIINKDAFYQALKEGNTRAEWGKFLLEGFKQIPTSEQFVEAHLRGWIDQKAMEDGTARWGMSPEDTKLEYQIHRRPLTPHQIKQALARGANFNPEAGEIQDPYTASVHQANLGPEWYELAVALQGSYPSLFQTNRLVTGGTISPDVGQIWLQRSGMADEVVTEIHKSWTQTTATVADPHVTKAEAQLWTTTHRSYVGEMIDDATATAALQAAGVAAAAIPAVLAMWKEERSLIRKQLTPAQIHKAYAKGVTNPATGQQWTLQEATAALLARGYDQADAETLLAE